MNEGEATSGTPGLVVLAFHRVVREPERDHDVAWDDFCSVLDGIRTDRLETSLASDPAMLRGVRVALTFDDATSDHADVAVELSRRGMSGIFFVPGARVGSASYLDASQLRSIGDQGHVIGAHGWSHSSLRDMPAERMRGEIRESKAALEDVLGHGIELFAPPGGIYARGLEAVLREEGFVAARSMVWGVHRSGQDRWRIPTIPVTSFILRRGWLDRTLEAGRMPASMAWTWRAKELLPERLRIGIRRAVHAAALSSRVSIG
jgi:peptidoglycan/xylan/chitin deacetylase (PgdA/CDA1 family)